MGIYDDGPLMTYGEYYGDVYGAGGGVAGLVLGLKAELYTGAWTDITDYVYQRDPVKIQLGRQDESSQISPASCSMTLNNRDGRFTTRNPVGAYYGTIGQNTPFRLSVPAYLAGQGTALLFADDSQSYVSCPDSSALQITSTLDVRIDMWLDDYQPCTLAGKWGASDADWSWCLVLNGDGTVTMWWYDGSDVWSAQSTAPLPYLGRIMVRAVIVAEDTLLASFFTAPDMAGSQTALGSEVTIGSDTVQAAAGQPVQVGYVTGFAGQSLPVSSSGCLGRVYEFRVYNSSGTLVADPVFSAQSAGATSFTDGESNTWTLEGTSALDDRCYRFHGEMSAWPKAADPSSRDAYSQATASGVLRRLQQGTTPVLSAMRRAIVSWPAGPSGGGLGAPPATIAYWPAEDCQGSAQIAAGIAQNSDGIPASAMMINGVTSFQGQSASPSADNVFACSAQLAQPDSSAWSGAVPGYSADATAVAVTFLLAIPSGGLSAGATLMYLNYGAGWFLNVNYSTASGGTLSIGGTLSLAGPEGINGQALLVQVANVATGAELYLSVLALGAGQDVSTYSTTSDTANLVSVTVNPATADLGETEIGHIWVTACASSGAGLPASLPSLSRPGQPVQCVVRGDRREPRRPPRRGEQRAPAASTGHRTSASRWACRPSTPSPTCSGTARPPTWGCCTSRAKRPASATAPRRRCAASPRP